jgi:hypothetical protein
MGMRAASFGEDQLLSSKKESEEGYYWQCDARLEIGLSKILAPSAARISLFLAPWRRVNLPTRAHSMLFSLFSPYGTNTKGRGPCRSKKPTSVGR